MNIKNLIPIMFLPLIIYFFSFSLLIYNLDFYDYLFQKNNITLENREGITKDLFQYFQSNDFSKPNFSYFKENENKHLLDVKIVIINSLMLLEIILLVFILWIVFISDQRNKIFLYGSLLMILINILFAVIPFDLLFDNFHFTLFTEGSWRFPQDYLLVNIYTQGFFYDFALNIWMISTIISILVFVLSLLASISFTTIKFK